jgi:ankyrin repeat protein
MRVVLGFVTAIYHLVTALSCKLRHTFDLNMHRIAIYPFISNFTSRIGLSSCCSLKKIETHVPAKYFHCIPTIEIFLFQDSVTQEETDDEAMNTVITEVTEFSDPDQTPDLGSKENLQGILGGSELESCDSRGETPIFWAARQGNTEAVRLLAAAGAKIASQNKVSEITHTWIFFSASAPVVLSRYST